MPKKILLTIGVELLGLILFVFGIYGRWDIIGLQGLQSAAITIGGTAVYLGWAVVLFWGKIRQLFSGTRPAAS